LAPASAQGSAARIGATGIVTDVAARGSVTVRSVGPDSSIAGNVDIVLGSGEHIRGGFRARWMPATLMCG
jgi:hypothetical protein